MDSKLGNDGAIAPANNEKGPQEIKTTLKSVFTKDEYALAQLGYKQGALNSRLHRNQILTLDYRTASGLGSLRRMGFRLHSMGISPTQHAFTESYE